MAPQPREAKVTHFVMPDGSVKISGPGFDWLLPERGDEVFYLGRMDELKPYRVKSHHVVIELENA